MAGTTRWHSMAGDGEGEAYAARLAARAATGEHMHGEADACERVLIAPPARVLDAGCGTGRVAVELARRGYEVVGVDLDPSMLAVARRSAPESARRSAPESARRSAPESAWVEADLSRLDDADLGDFPFDLVVCAGNVIPLMAAGTERGAVAAMAARLRPGGGLLCGFGLDVAHLPLDHVPVSLDEYDAWCDAAGLALVDRWATWEGEPYAGGGYAVSLHTRRE